MTAMFEGYGSSGAAYDEMFDGQALRPPYRRLRHSLREMSTPELVSRVEALQASYLDQGVTFDIGGEERAFPLDILPRVIEKGRVAVDGVSLTVVEAGPTSFTVSLIPETLARTTLGHRQVGDRVNLETDVIAKHVAKLVAAYLPTAAGEQHSKEQQA